MGEGPILIVEPRPGATAALGAWVRTGSAHEPPALAGATHLLEHLLLRRCGRRTPEAIAELTDSLGGAVDAFTTRESCAVTAHVPAGRFDEALDLTLDALFRPVLVASEVDTEKSVVAAEFDLVQDSPADMAAERALAACWGDHPVARPVLGDRGIVASLGPSALERFHAERFTLDRLLLVAVGPVSERAIAARLAGLPEAAAPGPVLTPPSWRAGVEVEHREGLEQVYVNLVLPGLPSGDPDAFPLGVLHHLLGAGNSSRLFRELRDRRGLVYDVESAVFSTSVAGVLEVTFSAPVRNLPACWDAVAGVLGEIAAGRIEDREVELARQALGAGVVLGTEGCDAVMEAHAGEQLSRGRRFDPAGVLAELYAVTPERVRALARRLVRLDLLAGAVCGPDEGVVMPGWVPGRAA